eukprot:gene8229-biopygen6399
MDVVGSCLGGPVVGRGAARTQPRQQPAGCVRLTAYLNGDGTPSASVGSFRGARLAIFECDVIGAKAQVGLKAVCWGHANADMALGGVALALAGKKEGPPLQGHSKRCHLGRARGHTP